MTESKGQTTLDFAIGMSVFLAVLVFVFSFVPGLLEPFVAAKDEEPVVADRIAGRLSQGALGPPEKPYVLERTCAVNFFNQSSPAGCSYDGTTLHDRLQLANRTNVNVTLAGNVSDTVSGSSYLCWNDSQETLKQVETNDCDEALLTGSTPPEDNSATVTARRVVNLDDESVTMEVVVW